MLDAFAQSVAVLTTLLTIAGIGYFCAALIAACAFLRSRRTALAAFSPGVSILKSLKGLDPGMIEAFRTHCRQVYAGEYELLFGVSALDDPAVAAVQQLMDEFPQRPIRLIECPERLGTNGKVSTLAQLAPHARYDFLLINDSDISVSPRYLERVMALFAPKANPSGAKAPADSSEFTAVRAKALTYQSCPGTKLGAPPFPRSLRKGWESTPLTSNQTAPLAGHAQKEVGLVTALYRGRAHGTLPSRLEALGIATDFQASVLLSKLIEGGLHYGLGSTLAVRRSVLDKIGGLAQLKDYLADDYQLGVRVDQAGYRVELSAEVVETAIPAYGWRGFIDHQLRWARTVRDARPWGYAGLIFVHGLGWALINLLIHLRVNGLAGGMGSLSLGLLGVSFLLRLAVAITVGTQVLGDRQVIPSLGLLPLRDLVAMGIWVAGFAGNTIVWRGERFAVKNGKLRKAN
jgi:ceramide glucosyltransferase